MAGMLGRRGAAAVELAVEKMRQAISFERSLLGQTCHGMPVAGGLNRVPERRVQAAVIEGPAALSRLGFRWLLLDTSAPGPGGATAAEFARVLGEPLAKRRLRSMP